MSPKQWMLFFPFCMSFIGSFSLLSIPRKNGQRRCNRWNFGGVLRGKKGFPVYTLNLFYSSGVLLVASQIVLTGAGCSKEYPSALGPAGRVEFLRTMAPKVTGQEFFGIQTEVK